jgi:hypothetical protein
MPNPFILIRMYIIVLCLLFLQSALFAQNRIIDSLSKLVALSPGDSVKSLLLTELASNYIGYDTAKCNQSLQKAYFILNQKNWNYNWGYYYETKSQYIFNQGKYPEALFLKKLN